MTPDEALAYAAERLVVCVDAHAQGGNPELLDQAEQWAKVITALDVLVVR